MKVKKFKRKMERFKLSQRDVWLSFWGIGKAYPLEMCSFFAGCLELNTGREPMRAKDLYDKLNGLDLEASVIISGTLYDGKPKKISASPIDNKLIIFMEA